MRITVRITKDVNNNLKEGDTRNLQPGLATELIRKGLAVKIGTKEDDCPECEKKRRQKEAASQPNAETEDLTNEGEPSEAEASEAEPSEAEASEATAFESMDYTELIKLLPDGYEGSRKKADVIAYLSANTDEDLL